MLPGIFMDNIERTMIFCKASHGHLPPFNPRFVAPKIKFLTVIVLVITIFFIYGGKIFNRLTSNRIDHINIDKTRGYLISEGNALCHNKLNLQKVN